MTATATGAMRYIIIGLVWDSQRKGTGITNRTGKEWEENMAKPGSGNGNMGQNG